MGEARSEKRGSASSGRSDSSTKKRAGMGARKQSLGKMLPVLEELI